MRRLSLIVLVLVAITSALVPASPAGAQVQAEPCQAFTPCIAVSGPYTTTPSQSAQLSINNCPANLDAVGADVQFQGAIYPVLIQVAGGGALGFSSVTFGVPALPVSVTYQPWIGCAPTGTITLQQFRRGSPAPARYRVHVRSRRVRPGRHVRAALGCGRGEHLVRAGSAMASYTRRPPSPRVLRALSFRSRRVGAVTRADVIAPPGLGDHGRVELQVTTICSH